MIGRKIVKYFKTKLRLSLFRNDTLFDNDHKIFGGE